MRERTLNGSSRVTLVAAGSLVLVVLFSVVAMGRASSSGSDSALDALNIGPRASVAPDTAGEATPRPVTTMRPRPSQAPAVPSATVPGTVTWRSGAFSGGSIAEHKEFAAWRGRKLDTALYFAPQESWAAMENPEYYTKEYAKDRSVLPVISYAMWPITETGNAQPNASGPAMGRAVFPMAAAGAFDEHWRTLAENLVEQGLPNAVIRPGWEFNGTWYRWSATGDTGARQFATYFQRIVTAMRSVPGARFTFSWSPVQAKGGLDLEKAYPGDEYVDDIGFDVYNTIFEPGATPDRQWDLILNIKYGLKWQLDFAKRHGKQVSYPEWAGYTNINPEYVRGSSGDDASFVRNMFAWMVAHPPAYENYFDFDGGDGVHYGIHTTTSLMTRSAEAYLAHWGR